MMGVVTDNTQSISLDFNHSGNATINNSLKRMELTYKDTVFKFAINPSDYTQKQPNRATITQTKGGAWIDAWGAGIVEFSIKGITGVSGRKVAGAEHSVDIGYQRWKELKELFQQIYQDIQDGEPVTELIKFYNYTDNEYWYCYPTQTGIELYRNRSKPHVYQYTINLWGIKRIGEPDTTTGVIGNPYKEQSIDEIDTSQSDDLTEESEETIVSGIVSDEIEEGENLNNVQNNTQANDSNTTQETNASVSGGNAYVTKMLSPHVQADTTIVTNTRTKTNATIRTQSNEYALQLAPIIGGHNGQLSPKTAYNCAKDLDISITGKIVNIPEFNATTLNRDYEIKEEGYIKFHRLMEEVSFVPIVSKETYLMQQQILNYSPEILSPEYILPIGSTPKERIMQAIKQSTKLDSTLYQLILKYQPKYYLSKLDIKYLKIIMLETMMVYHQLYKIYESKGQISTSLTPSSMKVLIKNLNSLVIYLETNSTVVNEFFIRNIMWELRKIEYIIVQITADIVEYV